jgi:succinate dehydrogenase/fumarate reductase flavoprotein subunit
METRTRINNCDVLVVGGGIAGLYAATTAITFNPKLKVMLVVADEIGSGGCSKNTQSVNASINTDDSVAAHIKDTINGGCGINNKKLVQLLCTEILERIKELESFGVNFDRNEHGYITRMYAGSSKGRALHAHGITGLRITQALVQRAILAGLFIKEQHWVMGLISTQGKICGIVSLNKISRNIEVYYAKSVILATGGGACVYPIASISSDKQASGITMAFDAGASLIDMEMVQFHPTGLLLPGYSINGTLLEEEIRTQGGILLNRNGRRYMFDYDTRGELATRDIVARGSYMEIMAGRGTNNGGVILSVSKLDKNTFLRNYPNTVKRLRACDVDLLTCDTIEISPTAHFLMGGILVDENGATGVSNLFACGEDAGGVHGANRLGGNGLAEALVFGYRAGLAAIKNAENNIQNCPSTNDLEIKYYALDATTRNTIKHNLKKIMWDNVGVVREGSKIKQALQTLQEIFAKLQPQLKTCKISSDYIAPDGLLQGKILQQKLQLAYLITLAADARKNSLGAHFRLDADGSSSLFNTLLRKTNDGTVNIALRQLEL